MSLPPVAASGSAAGQAGADEAQLSFSTYSCYMAVLLANQIGSTQHAVRSVKAKCRAATNRASWG